MSILRTIVALCIPVAVCACSNLTSPGSFDALRLDPLNTPPEELGLAVSVPDKIMLSDGDAIVRLAFATDGKALIDAQVPLSVEQAPVELQNKAILGEAVYAAFLTPENAAALAAAQAEIRALRAAGTMGKGTLSIAVVGGCRRGPPLETLYVSTWLRTAPSAPFVPLTRRVDVLDDLHAAGMTLRSCGG